MLCGQILHYIILLRKQPKITNKKHANKKIYKKIKQTYKEMLFFVYLHLQGKMFLICSNYVIFENDFTSHNKNTKLIIKWWNNTELKENSIEERKIKMKYVQWKWNLSATWSKLINANAYREKKTYLKMA